MLFRSDYFELQQQTGSMTDTESSDPDEADSADEQTEDGGDSEDYYRRVKVSGYEDNIDIDTTARGDCHEANPVTEGAESEFESETDTLLDHSEQQGKISHCKWSECHDKTLMIEMTLALGSWDFGLVEHCLWWGFGSWFYGIGVFYPGTVSHYGGQC